MFDYGMRDRNPIDEVRFYQKNNPNKPMIVRKEEVCIQIIQNNVKNETHNTAA